MRILEPRLLPAVPVPGSTGRARHRLDMAACCSNLTPMVRPARTAAGRHSIDTQQVPPQAQSRAGNSFFGLWDRGRHLRRGDDADD